MTLVIKQHKNENYYISMGYEKNNTITVEACPIIDENTCGYPIKKITYAINDEKNALATFNRYVKKYT